MTQGHEAGVGDGDGGEAPLLFRGATLVTLDPKGRIAVPAKHRDKLCPGGAPMVLTVDPSRCLMLYPKRIWDPIQLRLLAFTTSDERVRLLQRLMVGFAEDIEMDAAGRILISQSLREYARLDKHVMFVGQGRRFELWDQAAWAEQTAQALDLSAGGLPPALADFAL